MQDYTPNSHRFKEEQKKPIEEKKDVQKVVKGKAHIKKKSATQSAIDNFIAEDLTNIKTYLVSDVIIPTIKNTIWDAFTNTLDMILFKGEGRSRRNGSSRAPYISYNKVSDRGRDNRSSNEPRRNRYNFDSIGFDSKSDAEEVLRQMDALLDEYKLVTVADLYDLVGETGEYTDQKYGWTNLRNAHTVRVRDGYVLDLPKPLPID